MKPLFEALAKQAEEYALEFATQDQSLYIPKLLEKFAELIIEECANNLEFHGFDEAIPYVHWMVKNKLGVNV